ncbi:unnamed protein product [Hermetia illucens]|uniref:Peptidase S1 domain-containing protein n=1 Tax=Hermetia illucens TaxID=343691 RepID=A0A7R8YYW7_HERIL|nr:trypsin beta-like [Hermetia illucens]CAD7089402.1 unnamed protein product [Hermetia illucens]
MVCVTILGLLTSTLVVSSSGNPLHLTGLHSWLNGRIVGGEETTIERFPFQGSFRMYGYHRCGAVIIKAHVATTAGHCVDDQDTWYLSVKAGVTEWEDEGMELKVKDYIAHEDYSIRTLESDIALLFLEGGFEFSNTIQPIYLASYGEELHPSTKAYVSGWGTMKENGSALSEKLRFAAVTIWDQEECEDAYEGINNVTSTMICAGEPQGGVDPCEGDSGGPLIVGNKLFGTVSWGLGCARPGKPSVYVKISALRKWIDSKLLAANAN